MRIAYSLRIGEKPGADWETLAVNDMGEPGYATPAIEDGRIYFRTASSLYCFENH